MNELKLRFNRGIQTGKYAERNNININTQKNLWKYIHRGTSIEKSKLRT